MFSNLVNVRGDADLKRDAVYSSWTHPESISHTTWTTLDCSCRKQRKTSMRFHNASIQILVGWIYFVRRSQRYKAQRLVAYQAVAWSWRSSPHLKSILWITSQFFYHRATHQYVVFGKVMASAVQHLHQSGFSHGGITNDGQFTSKYRLSFRYKHSDLLL